MSDQDESNKNSTNDTTLSEMEERINKRIDDRASDHDRTTRAHIDGIYKAMDLMGEKMDVKVDGIEKSMQKQYEGLEKSMQKQYEGLEKSMQKQYEGLEKSMQNQYEGLEKSMQNQFAELKSSITELREIVEKQNAASNKLRDDMTKHTLWLFGTLVTVAGIVIAAVAVLT